MIGHRFIRFARFVPSAPLRVAHLAISLRIVQVAVPGLFFLLTACGGNMEDPRIELNPHPTMRYKITVTIAGAPGPFDNIEASVDYGVSNFDCVPEQPISGARLLPQKHVPLKLSKLSETTYVADMYADLIKDEDYYSLGTCHWSLAAVMVNVTKNRMRFTTPLTSKNFSSKKDETRYYSFDSYRDSNVDTHNIGNTDRNAYRNAADTFSIRVTARATQQ